MKKLVLIICSGIFPFLISHETLACICARDPSETTSSAVKKQLKRSHLVFVGVPVEANSSGLRFSVVKVWKGRATNSITFPMYRTSDKKDVEIFINSCALPFDMGKKYLVYAELVDGEIFVHKCSRTRILQDAGEDIVELDRRAPKSQTF